VFIDSVKTALVSSGLHGDMRFAVRAAVEKDRSDCLVLDTVDNFNGLERLIVIAVGLDSPMHQGAGSETPSHLYRGITRAQLAVVVVNEVVQGGWLEFMTRLKFDENSE
jgi:hypothetical protein